MAFFKNAIRYGVLSGPLLFAVSRIDFPAAVIAHCVVGTTLLSIAIFLRQPFDLEKFAERPGAYISQQWLRKHTILGCAASFFSALAIVLLEMNAPVDRLLMIGLLISGLLVTCLPGLAMNASDES